MMNEKYFLIIDPTSQSTGLIDFKRNKQNKQKRFKRNKQNCFIKYNFVLKNLQKSFQSMYSIICLKFETHIEKKHQHLNHEIPFCFD